ncbi:hypothetical protein Tco_0564060 [Tanacetum coccineum]
MDSWGWRNILSVRKDVRYNMVTKLGDGYTTSLCVRMTVKELMGQSNWSWPEDWTNMFPLLFSIHNVNLNENKSDKIVWRSRGRKLTKKIDVDGRYVDWNTNVSRLANRFNGNSIGSIIRSEKVQVKWGVKLILSRNPLLQDRLWVKRSEKADGWYFGLESFILLLIDGNYSVSFERGSRHAKGYMVEC